MNFSDIHFSITPCSIGLLLTAKTKQGLCAIFIDDDAAVLKQQLAKRFPEATLVETAFLEESKQVAALIENPASHNDFALDIHGTDFQKRVYQALLNIPLGQTVTYSDIALQINAPTSVRAVAQACGANPLAIVIPCHRVIGKNGKLTGYHWGVERKKILLQHENVNI